MRDYILTRPNEDEWESVQNVTKIFLDCWWTDSPVFRVDGNTMSVFDEDNNEIIRFEYYPDGHPDGEQYNLTIEFWDHEENYDLKTDTSAGGFYGDTYPIF
jgi:hypothetical protein